MLIFNIYIDDLGVITTADTEDEVVETLEKAGKDLARTIKTKLKGQISKPKLATVASSKSLAGKIRKALGVDGGQEMHQAPNLGIDFSAGKKRGRVRKGTM